MDEFAGGFVTRHFPPLRLWDWSETVGGVGFRSRRSGAVSYQVVHGVCPIFATGGRTEEEIPKQTDRAPNRDRKGGRNDDLEGGGSAQWDGGRERRERGRSWEEEEEVCGEKDVCPRNAHYSAQCPSYFVLALRILSGKVRNIHFGLICGLISVWSVSKTM